MHGEGIGIGGPTATVATLRVSLSGCPGSGVSCSGHAATVLGSERRLGEEVVEAACEVALEGP